MARNLELLNNIAMVSNEAKINVYTAKYRKNSKDSNYCISWPDNENEYIKRLLINDLNQYSRYKAVDFDPQKRVTILMKLFVIKRYYLFGIQL